MSAQPDDVLVEKAARYHTDEVSDLKERLAQVTQTLYMARSWLRHDDLCGAVAPIFGTFDEEPERKCTCSLAEKLARIDKALATITELEAKLATAREALEAIAALSKPNWLPIETAPRDGERILVWGGRHKRPEIVEADGDWWISVPYLRAVPTHWMPLSEPPALSALPVVEEEQG